jgi:hypothetical protein
MLVMLDEANQFLREGANRDQCHVVKEKIYFKKDKSHIKI